MNSPIPEPAALDLSTVPPRAKMVRGPRPLSLNVVTGLKILSMAAYWFFGQSGDPRFASGEAELGHGAVQALQYFTLASKLILIYLTWRGVNWARVLMVINNLLVLSVVFRFHRMPEATQLTAGFSLLVSMVSIYVLLSPSVVGFCKGVPAET